jgi:hypothetical protein
MLCTHWDNNIFFQYRLLLTKSKGTAKPNQSFLKCFEVLKSLVAEGGCQNSCKWHTCKKAKLWTHVTTLRAKRYIVAVARPTFLLHGGLKESLWVIQRIVNRHWRLLKCILNGWGWHDWPRKVMAFISTAYGWLVVWTETYIVRKLCHLNVPAKWTECGLQWWIICWSCSKWTNMGIPSPLALIGALLCTVSKWNQYFGCWLVHSDWKQSYTGFLQSTHLIQQS